MWFLEINVIFLKKELSLFKDKSLFLEQQAMQQWLEHRRHVTLDDLHPHIFIISRFHCDAKLVSVPEAGGDALESAPHRCRGPRHRLSFRSRFEAQISII